MKKFLKRSLLLLAVLAVVLAFTGCAREPSIPTYSIWSFSGSQTLFNNDFDPDLGVNYCGTYVFTESQYSSFTSQLGARMSPNNWTEEEVKNSLLEVFPTSQASDAIDYANWLMGSTRRMFALCYYDSDEGKNMVWCLLH